MRLIAGIALSMALAVVSPAQALIDAGSLAHFASGGGWRTTFFLSNTGTLPSDVQLNFFNDVGLAAVIPLRLPQLTEGVAYPPATQFNYTLQPGTVLAVESDSSDTTATQGWAQLKAGTNVTGYLIFRYAGIDGEGVQEAVVTPETRNGKSYVIGFDNTNQHFTSFALANVTNQQFDVTVIARDAVTGEQLGTPTIITLHAMDHWARLLSDIVENTAYTSGTVEFTTPSPGQISVLGLRFTKPSNAFTSTPPIMKK